MPDASGNFKGISLMNVKWPKGMTAAEAADRSKLSVSDGGDAARENSPASPEITKWNEACKHAFIASALKQAEQDR